MEKLKDLFERFKQSGTLFLIGIILIVYIAFGFVYWQQTSQQDEYTEQINSLSAVISKPLPGMEKIKAEHDEVKLALAPPTDQEAIALLVSIADKYGIDVKAVNNKFYVPTASYGEATVGSGSYKLISFRGIRVLGDHDDVMAFISDLDSGKTLANMVLTGVVISKVGVTASGEDGIRRTEFREVRAALKTMMADNNLPLIVNPVSYITGFATNLMGDDPDTSDGVEGFPDITITAVQKGYTGTDSPRDGFVLYGHDKIPTDNTTQFVTIDYLPYLSTKYYYTCEISGLIRQFDRAIISLAKEYITYEEFKVETQAVVDVDIYVLK